MSSSAASGDADEGVGLAGSGATIPVICGPTASGKSRIAMRLAAGREITIVSADSRQIYRGFDIGTAKPTIADRRAVPHRAVDIVEPTERYSAAQWAKLAERSIAETLELGRIPVIVGGTGFYISALFRPLFQEPTLDAADRRRLQDAVSTTSTEELRRWCEALDPARAHLGRAQLLRAIEVALLAGERLSDLHRTRPRARRFRASYLLVDPGPVLAARIVSRAGHMLEQGWIDEVRTLTRDVPERAPAWGATGYDAVRRMVRGEIDRDAALEQVVIDTRQYAKRQRTWFRHQLPAHQVTRVDGAGQGRSESIVDDWMSELEAGLRSMQRQENSA
jgi:tRNA dimethylallyltransferase